MNAEQLKQHMSHAPSEHPGSQQADDFSNRDYRDAVIAGELLTAICHGAAKRSGWWTNLKTCEDLTMPNADGSLRFNVPEKLMLVVSELGEGMEGFRKNKADEHLPQHPNLTVELADTVIRVFDLAGAMGLNLALAIAEKLEYNAQRADHKIENRLGENGKKF